MDEISSLYTRSAKVDFSIDEAKSAFERNAKSLEIRPLTTNPGTRNGKKTPVITPLWQKGEIYSNEDGAFANVPFNIPLVKVFGRKKTDDTLLSDDEKYSNTDIRLLVQKTQENEYIYTVVYITGDFSYVIDKHKKVKSLRLDKLDAFSGEIRYFTLEGNLLWGEIYKNGKKIGTISVADSSVDGNIGKVQTRSYVTVCEPHLVEYETCYHYGYDIGEGYVENGVDCFYDYTVEDYCYDEWVEDETGCPLCGSPYCNGECQYEGGDSGNTEDNVGKGNKPLGKKYTPSPNDKFARGGIPTKMDVNQSQIANTCVFSAISYMAQIFGQNVTQGEAITEYWKIAGEYPQDGVNSTFLYELLEFYFNVSPCNNSIASINNGDIVYATASVDGGGHAIVFVGYDSTDNSIIFMDPMSGTLRQEDESNPFMGITFYAIREKTK